MTKMLKISSFQMMTGNTSQINSVENVCLDIGVDLKTEHIEAKMIPRLLLRNSLI